MGAAPPSPPASSPRGNSLPVEALQDLLRGLVRERQHLRSAGAHEELEGNRSQIVALQWALSRALVARYAA
ncbi:MAG: hypothetical protein ICV74_08180 [Thermoleophilia bacterium]|nr:hypothetical protein [Thermoleophilia bacterium]